MADITTPILARKTEEFTISQIELVRNSLAIADNPMLLDKTYVVYDAIAGNNNFQLDTGGALSYSINKGQGGLPANFNDTGGVKVLNYTNAGRYLITIESVGLFHGLEILGTQADKDKYIAVFAGSNYPVSIVQNAFKDTHNLESVSFPFVTSTLLGSFENCIKLKDVHFPLLTSIGIQCFKGCDELEGVSFPLVTSLNGNDFQDCIILKSISFPVLTTLLQANEFNGCVKLENVNIPLVTNLAGSTFLNCSGLKEINISLVTNIGLLVFSGCTALKIIHFKSSVIIQATAFSNVILTDVFVDGTEAQANTIVTDIVTAGGLFSKDSRLIFGSETRTNVVSSLSVDNEAGFGTETPDTRIHIHEVLTTGVDFELFKITTQSGGAITIRVSNLGASNPEWEINSNANEVIKFSQNGVERLVIDTDGGIEMKALKSGTTQGGAGASADELWVDTDDDNSIKLGI